MTEQEWLACTDPRLGLIFLEDKASGRKARLFACGLGRYLEPFLGDNRSRQVVEVAEKHADGLATNDELAAAREAALDAQKGAASGIASSVGDHWPWQGARMMVIAIQQAQMDRAANDWSATLIRRSRALLRCVFGNPFRPVTVDPIWLTATVVSLATAIYDDRAFDRLPILADALEDAGCTNTNIRDHCRLPGEHARGCWAVDLLLNKS